LTNPKPITLDDELRGPRQHVNVIKLTDAEMFKHEVLVSRTLMKAPLFSYLLLSKMEIVYTLDVPVAATDEFRILLNPKTFFINYTADEQVFILCHEVFHKIRRDCALGMRYGRNGRLNTTTGWLDYDHGTGNKTADYIINAALVKAKIGTLPKDGLYDPSIATGEESFAEVYPKVYQRGSQQRQGPDRVHHTLTTNRPRASPLSSVANAAGSCSRPISVTMVWSPAGP